MLDGHIEYTATLKNPKKVFLEKITYLGEAIEQYLTVHEYDLVVIEKPEFQESKRSITSLNDTLVHLTCGFATILNAALDIYPPPKIQLVNPSEWKGNCPKRITKQRMVKRFGKDTVGNLPHDEIDALGLAVYAIENE